MKKHIFNKSLYLDALKQTRIFSILCITVFLFINLAVPIDTIINFYDTREAADFANFAPVMMVVPYAVTPVLCLICFGFMNKRKSADFYHSIADTRTSLYLSLFLAVITCVAGIIVISTAPSLLLHYLYKKVFIVNLKSILINLFGIMASSIYCAAIVTIAMSLTGTLLTNVAVSAILLFFPDFITTVSVSTLCEVIPVLPNIDYFGKLMPSGFNIISLLFFGNTPWTEIFEDISRSITTLILSLPVILIAVWVFKRRKSETAGYPTQNKYLQAAFRIICSFIVSFFATILVFDGILSGENYIERIYYIVLIYIASLLIYFICELITTKKLKNLVRIIPGFTVVILLNVLFIATLFGAYNICLSFTPKANEIEYVRFISGNTSEDLSGYYIRKNEDIKLTDKDVKKLISESLRDDVEKTKADTYYRYSASPDTYYSMKRVMICVNGRERIREIRLSEEEHSFLSEKLKQNPKYQSSYNSLPPLGKGTDILYYGEYLTTDDARRIYDIMRKEVASIDFETWYSMVEGYGGRNIGEGFWLSTVVDMESVEIYVPIYLELKESAEEYFKIVSTKDNKKDILSAIDKPETVEYLRAEIYTGDSTYYLDFDPNLSNESEEEMLDFLSGLSEEEKLNTDKPVLAVYADFFIDDEYGGYWNSVKAYFNYTGDLEKLITEAGYAYE